MSDGRTGRRPWVRVSGAHPCPICEHSDWCRVTPDGRRAACMRVEEGSYSSKAGKDGSTTYLHRLDGSAKPPPAPPPSCGTKPERADAATLNAIYEAMLAALPLIIAHREALQRRGLKDEESDRRGYGSLPRQGRHRVARDLHERFGDVVQRVPGVYTKQGDRGPYLTLAGAVGLLIPVRDAAGRIVAILSRRDDKGSGNNRYTYLSSVSHGGPGPGSPVHVPLGIAAPVEILRITEGSLKGDIAHALSGLPTIGLPGVSNWRPVLPIVREMGCRTVRLAIDADASDKAPVARALSDLSEALLAEGLAVELERWDIADGKGIDDLLAVGKVPEVLAGDDVRLAIADIVAEGTADEPPPEPSPLDRLDTTLNDGGPEALYRDDELLGAIARLAESDPAEFACVRARVQRAGVKLRDLDRALSPLRHSIRRDRPALDAAGQYRIAGGRLVRDAATRDGTVEIVLATWHGRIVEEVTRDDGAEKTLTLAIEGALADGTPLPRVEVLADDFPSMRWAVKNWGTRAVVLAGAGTADHVRTGIQLLSGDVPRRTVFAHTGWREVGGQWAYLHAGGAIGPDGPLADITVSLPEALAGYSLPDPPEGARLVEDVRASLRMLELAADRITVPLLGAVFRSVLDTCDSSVHLAGQTGQGKSELAALGQQHFGAGMDARHFAGSWSSTGNALEGLAFALKDAVLVIDDFAPNGSSADVARMHREADRVFRAQGNRSGRMRMRIDGSLRPSKPPRGLILSTGEDVPKGQSLRARLLTVELSPGDPLIGSNSPPVKTMRRPVCTLKGFPAICDGSRPRYTAVRDGLRSEVAALRERAQADGQHARTPVIMADLAAGWQHWLDFALSVGAISKNDKRNLEQRVWEALTEAGNSQAEHLASAEPCGQFLRLLAGALASGRAYVAAADGTPPADADAWGWRASGETWQPQPGARCIGWIDGDELYLEPEAAYAEAQELARQQSDSMPTSRRVDPLEAPTRSREAGQLGHRAQAPDRPPESRRSEEPRRN